MIVLIGLDDTDNKESRGTGFQARNMAMKLSDNPSVKIHGITRHQHYVHPDIPYTSQNSSACIAADVDDPEQVWAACSEYLAAAAAEGSDAGLSMAFPRQIDSALTRWAFSSKCEVLQMDDAYALAIATGIQLQGFTGSRQGIIGALAAVALRHSGNDGRFIATGHNLHLRELPPGTYLARDLLSVTHADLITDLHQNPIPSGSRIWVRDYLRPVLRNRKCTILVTQTETDHDWESAGKDILRNY